MSKIPFKEAFLFWLKLGFISFGGPAGQIAIMHQYLVEKKKWISESTFLHALNYCMLLPGPEAQQLATYSGWLMHGTIGGIAAGSLFILPSVFILLGLSSVYITYGNTDLVISIFYGIKPAVLAVVFLALWKIAGRALKTKMDYAIALTALVVILIFKLPYPLVILGAIITGVILVKVFRIKADTAEIPEAAGGEGESVFLINKNSIIPHGNFILKRFVLQLTFFFTIWLAPFLLFYLYSSDYKFWKNLSLFFSQAAFFTFGGAYSILVYVAQVAVDKLHWLTQSQMVDGLALGETTPGPLMMVLTFVGFIGAYHHFNNSLTAGCIGLLITAYYIFLPSFMFILMGAPIIGKTQQNSHVKLALGFVTAAVVGVIANLALFTAKAVLFPVPVALAGINWFAVCWVVISIIAMKKFDINMILWIGVSAVTGVAVRLL